MWANQGLLSVDTVVLRRQIPMWIPDSSTQRDYSAPVLRISVLGMHVENALGVHPQRLAVTMLIATVSIITIMASSAVMPDIAIIASIATMVSIAILPSRKQGAWICIDCPSSHQKETS